MRKRISCLIALSTLFSVGVASAQDPDSVVRRVRRDTQGTVANIERRHTPTPQFKEIQAGYVSMRVPTDWNVIVSALGEDLRGTFVVMGPNGEGVSIYAFDAMADEQSRQNAIDLLSSRGASPALIEQLLPKIVLQPMPPLETWQALAVRAGQSPELLKSVPIGDGQSFGAARFRTVVDWDQVREQFAQAGATLPPELQGAVRHEGLLTVGVAPPINNGLFNYWEVVMINCYAPVELFRRNAAVYVASLGTLEVNAPSGATSPPVDPGRLAKIARAPFDRMMQSDPHYQEQMQDLSAALGNNVIYRGPEGESHQLPIPDARSNTRYYWCDLALIPEGDPRVNSSCSGPFTHGRRP